MCFGCTYCCESASAPRLKLSSVTWLNDRNVFSGAIWAPFLHLSANIVKVRYGLTDGFAAVQAAILLSGALILYPVVRSFTAEARFAVDLGSPSRPDTLPTAFPPRPLGRPFGSSSSPHASHYHAISTSPSHPRHWGPPSRASYLSHSGTACRRCYWCCSYRASCRRPMCRWDWVCTRVWRWPARR